MRLGLFQLGEASDDAPDLPAARHAIDMLAMIAEKTKGNLSLDEQRLIENSLTELRFRFVQVSESAPKPASEEKRPEAERARPPLSITVLGSGTSSGVPTIGCTCEVCSSTDPRDKRLRPSILVQYGGKNVLVDTTPDFRQQALRAGIIRLDAILYTHAHADHILGLDDVRPLNYRQKMSIPVYGTEETLAALQRVFCYAFDEKIESLVPSWTCRRWTRHPSICSASSFSDPPDARQGHPVRIPFRDAAYLTDHSDIPESQRRSCGVWTCCFWMPCGTARIPLTRPWSAPGTGGGIAAAAGVLHAHVPRLAACAHGSALPPHVRLAYDGLEIDVERDCRCDRPLPRGSRRVQAVALTIGNFDGVHPAPCICCARPLKRAAAPVCNRRC